MTDYGIYEGFGPVGINWGRCAGELWISFHIFNLRVTLPRILTRVF